MATNAFLPCSSISSRRTWLINFDALLRPTAAVRLNWELYGRGGGASFHPQRRDVFNVVFVDVFGLHGIR